MNYKFLFVYHQASEGLGEWSLPSGFSQALRSVGHSVVDLAFESPSQFSVSFFRFFEANIMNFDVLLSFYAGRSVELESLLMNAKKLNPNILIISELGDEPQTYKLNRNRALCSDIILTPCHKSFIKWNSQGFSCHWFTHWADSLIFKKDASVERKIFLSTTAGKRKYTSLLSFLLGKKFRNQKVYGLENTFFYNVSVNAFQYARWGEVTRRIFEAAACGCCVLTNRLSNNTKLETIFRHNESIIYYSGPFSLLFEIAVLLLRPQKSVRIAFNCYNIVQKSHTSTARALQLTEIMDQYTQG